MNPILSKAAPYLIAALVGGGWWLSHNAKQRQIGRLQERLHVADSALVVERREGRRADSTFRVDTVRLTRRITTTQTLLDTLRLSDTVTLTQRESVLVFVADSLVQQCRQTVQSCTQLTLNLQRRLTLTEQQRDAYKRLQPSGFGKAMTTARDAAIGAALCYLLCPKR